MNYKKRNTFLIISGIILILLGIIIKIPISFASSDPINLKDINIGAGNASVQNAVAIGGVVYFSASSGSSGTELYKSDGTVGGTSLVKDINPGAGSSNPSFLVNMGGVLYFAATDGSGGVELYKSDGTSDGTLLVKDIKVGSGSSNPSYLIAIGSSIYFSADDGASGVELYKSDGTSLGTVLVKDINTGVSDSNPIHLTNLSGTLIFVANDGVNGAELYKSDGTSVGTVLVKDINVGASDSQIYSFINYDSLFVANGLVYFSADDGANGAELYKSDGTSLGTVLVKDINAGAIGSSPDWFANVGSDIYFAADDGVNGVELYKSDGTSLGTVLVKDIYPGTSGSYPTFLINIGGIIYFGQTDGDGVNGSELWKSDGTSGGTVMVKDINSGINNSGPAYLIDVSGVLYFTAYGDSSGNELYKSDGTALGTTLIYDINPGVSDSLPLNLTAFSHYLFFSASTPSLGQEPWILDLSSISVPTLSTSTASSITTTTAILNGNITATGGANATVRGFDYGTTLSYGTTTIENGDFGTGSFSSSISGLSCNTLYYFRAYATNSAGTGTGSSDSFTTSACPVSEPVSLPPVIGSGFTIINPPPPPPVIIDPKINVPTIPELTPTSNSRSVENESMKKIDPPEAPVLEKKIIAKPPTLEVTLEQNNVSNLPISSQLGENSNLNLFPPEPINVSLENNTTENLASSIDNENPISVLMLGFLEKISPLLKIIFDVIDISKLPFAHLFFISPSHDLLAGVGQVPYISLILTLFAGLGLLVVLIRVLNSFFVSPARFLDFFLITIGIKKYATPWGVVYDAITKKPLDLVSVILKDEQGNVVAKTITDIDGKFGFLVNSGKYYITINKNNYLFPSQKLQGKTQDELYDHLYFGAPIEVSAKNQLITCNIPIDNVKFDEIESLKHHTSSLKFYASFHIAVRRLADLLFALGFIFAIIGFLLFPIIYNFLILQVYLFIILLDILGVKPRALGRVIQEATGDPVSFAVIKITSIDNNMQVGQNVTDEYGRYYCLIPKGNYVIHIEKKHDDGSYQSVYTSKIIHISRSEMMQKTFRI